MELEVVVGYLIGSVVAPRWGANSSIEDGQT